MSLVLVPMSSMLLQVLQNPDVYALFREMRLETAAEFSESVKEAGELRQYVNEFVLPNAHLSEEVAFRKAFNSSALSRQAWGEFIKECFAYTPEERVEQLSLF